MAMLRIKTAVIVFLFTISIYSHSLMITSTKIAYVNIEKVFNEMKKVKEAKKSLKKLVEQKKLEIKAMERAIASVRNKVRSKKVVTETKQLSKTEAAAQSLPVLEVVSSTQTLPVLETEVSTQTLPAVYIEASTQTLLSSYDLTSTKQVSSGKVPAFEIREFEKMLSEKENELKKLMQDSKRLILSKEKRFKYEIMGKIYDRIKSIADDEGYTVIFDKDTILFSVETVVDITDKVLRSLDE